MSRHHDQSIAYLATRVLLGLALTSAWTATLRGSNSPAVLTAESAARIAPGIQQHGDDSSVAEVAAAPYAPVVGALTAPPREAEPTELSHPAPLPRKWIDQAAPLDSDPPFAALGGLFGDFDADGDVDLHDFIAFRICMSFSSPGFDVPAACLGFDSDGDGDIDLTDLAAFENAFDHSYAGVLVEAGNVPPVVPHEGFCIPVYFFLHGNAAHAGYSASDLWYEWSVVSQPPGSGAVAFENESERITAVNLLPPYAYGEFRFELKVTNLLTLEFGLDEVTVEAVACRYDYHCDQDACVRESCIDGTCVPDPVICAPPLVCCSWCGAGASCVECRGNADCPANSVCQGFQCVTRCEFDFECDDGDVCSTDYCDVYYDVCRHAPLCNQEDDVCIDGTCYRACAVDSNCDGLGDRCNPLACLDGICVQAQEPIDCDDGDACTEDGCSICDGCYHHPSNCDDCNACTIDSCNPELGCVHTPVVCPEGQHCDVCAGGCVGQPLCVVDADCDDGLFCNGVEACVDGVCVGGSNPCPDDGLFCNGTESCVENPPSCVSSGEPCKSSLCNEQFDFCNVDPFCLEYTLGQDVLTGTSGNDCFVAQLIFNPPTGTSIPSFQTGDSANGGSGFDALEAWFNASAVTTVVGTLNGIEELSFTDLGTAALTLSGLNWTGVTSVRKGWGTNPNTLTITNLPALANIGLLDTASGINVGYQSAATSGSADALTFTLDDACALAGSCAVTINTGSANGVETVNIDATGNNVLSAITQTTGTTLAALNITGSGSLRVTAPLPSTVTTVNAGTNTGGVDVTVGTGAVAATGGTGSDTFVYGANYTSADTINGGAGTDTLGLTTVTSAVASDQLNVAAIEALTILDTHITAATISRFGGGINKVNLPLGSNGGSLTVPSGTTLAVGARSANNDSPGTLSVTVPGVATTDTLNLIANDSDFNGAVALIGVETCNLASNGDLDGTAADGGVNTFAAVNMLDTAASEVLNITGSAPITFNGNITANTVNASTLAQELTMTLGSSALASAGTITGGLADDTLVGSTGADILNGGPGNDMLRGRTGLDLINVGSGADTVDLEDLSAATLIAAHRDLVSGMTINGQPFTPGSGDVDALRFGNVASNADLSDGASPAEFSTITTPASLTASGTVAILELAWEFTPSQNLNGATNGTNLLAGCGATSGSTACTISSDGIDEDFFIIAYQNGNAYVFFANGTGGDTNVAAGEIALVMVINGGVTVGGFVPSNFQ